MAYLHKNFVDFMAVKSNFFISKFQTRLKNQKIYMSIFKANYQVGASNLTYKAFQSLSYFKCHFVRPKSVFIELQYYGKSFSENYARSR